MRKLNIRKHASNKLISVSLRAFVCVCVCFDDIQNFWRLLQYHLTSNYMNN